MISYLKNTKNSSKALQCYLRKKISTIPLQIWPRWIFYYTTFRNTQSWNTPMHVQVPALLHTLTGFVSTNQLTLEKVKELGFSSGLGKRKEGVTGEKESLTHYIQSSWWTKSSTSCRKILQNRKQKGRNQCWLLIEAPTSKFSRDPVWWVRISFFWKENTRAQVARASQKCSTSYSRDLR